MWLTGLPKDIHCLVYAAAADGGNETDYSNAYVHGPRNLMTVFAAANPLERIIFLSSTRVFAQNNGEWVDEISPTQPTDFRGNTRLAGEKLMLEQNVRAVVLRLGGIYGAGRGSLVSRVREGASCVQHPPRFTNRIHRDDCAGAIHHLLDLPSPAPVYIGVDDAPAPQCEVMDWIAAKLEVLRPTRVAPDASRKTTNKRCSNRLLKKSDYQFSFPTYREGYSGLLE